MPKKKINELESSIPSPSGKFLFEADNGINNYITHDNLFSKYATKTESDEKYFLKSDLNDLINMMYPVGSLYLSTTATHPGTLFGVGEWEQIQDTFLMASGTTYPAGSTGGEATHTLTINEMPTHTHPLSYRKTGGGGGTTWYCDPGTAEGFNTNAEKAIGNTGGGQPHNNLPPYLSIYVYKRKA